MKRKISIAFVAMIALALSASVAMATGQKYQTAAVGVAPKKLPAKKAAPIALTITTTTGDPGEADGIPSPATRAFVNFDNDMSVNFNAGGLQPCEPSSLNGLTTNMAKSTCPQSILGGGMAKVRLPWPSDSGHLEVDVVVTAFKATKDSEGRNRIILFSRNDSLATGSALIGTFKKSTAGRDYGLLLDVDIPLLVNGEAALTYFKVTVGNGYKRGFVSSKCADRDRKLNLSTRFFYYDGTSLPAKASTTCRR